MGEDRQEIIDYILSSKLVETCVQYRLNKCRSQYLKDEMVQEVWLWLCSYDIGKLRNAYENRHLSALITRFIINQYFSKTSPFYKKFKKFDLCSDELTYKELKIPDEV